MSKKKLLYQYYDSAKSLIYEFYYLLCVQEVLSIFILQLANLLDIFSQTGISVTLFCRDAIYNRQSNSLDYNRLRYCDDRRTNLLYVQKVLTQFI